jgi:Uma2 family endonuclease
MTAMTVDGHYPDASDPLTVEDLERIPDDGRRYELLDGILLVSPAPGTRHQKVVLRTGMRLEEACPEAFEVLIASYAVQPANDVEL